MPVTVKHDSVAPLIISQQLPVTKKVKLSFFQEEIIYNNLFKVYTKRGGT